MVDRCGWPNPDGCQARKKADADLADAEKAMQEVPCPSRSLLVVCGWVCVCVFVFECSFL